MRRVIGRSGVLSIVLGLTSAGIASASTLGTTTQPSGSNLSPCASEVAFAQTGSAAGTPYVLHAAGVVDRWSTNVTGATPGAVVYLLVLHQHGSNMTVVGVDHGTVPNPLPASGVVSFKVTSPIVAQAGDILGLYSASSAETCAWGAGSIPSAATVSEIAAPGPAPLSGPPAKGQVLVSPSGSSPNAELNVSAVVVPAISDAAVTAGFAPARPTIGELADLTAKVVNHGPQAATITFRDTVPSGLDIEAASTAGGTCSVAGQLVGCTIPSLASGGARAVSVIVLPKKTGAYTNSVSVSVPAGFKDPTPANNSSTAALTVSTPGPSNCVVPTLKATPASVAEHVLKLLGCKVKLKSEQGHGVPKGTVLKTQPGSGTYALNQLITVLVRK